MADGIWVEIKNGDEVIGVFNRLNVQVAKRVRDVVSEISLLIQNGAKQRCPVDTTRLRSSIHTVFSKDGFGSEVGTNVEYASCVEFGTAPHKIKPKNKKYLRFKVKGKWVSKKEVNHPGTKPHPFLFPSGEEQQENYVNKMRAALKAGVDEASR